MLGRERKKGILTFTRGQIHDYNYGWIHAIHIETKTKPLPCHFVACVKGEEMKCRWFYMNSRIWPKKKPIEQGIER